MLTRIFGFLFVVGFLVVNGIACLGVIPVRAQDGTASVTPVDSMHTGTDQWQVYLPLVDRLSNQVYNCRYGVAGSTTAEIENLRAGAFISFGTSMPQTLPTGVEFIPMIRIKQDRGPGGSYLPSYTVGPTLTESGLGAAISRNPGALWLVGNEPDRAYHQDDTFPDIYAQAYHDVYSYIKERDPSAQVAIAGLVLVSPGRLQYLDKVWDAYVSKYGTSIPVDMWNFHAYLFPERNADGTTSFAGIALGTDSALAWLSSGGNGQLCSREDVMCIAEHDDVDLFAQQILEMRKWMKAHGQQEKPLLLSEFSLLYPYVQQGDTCVLQDENGRCFDPARVNDYMNKSVSRLENMKDTELGYAKDDFRLVQQWVWFSLDDFGGGSGMNLNPSLLIPSGGSGLSPMGMNYRDLIAQQPNAVNLLIESVAVSGSDTATQALTEAITLTANILNNGNSPTTKTVDVSFFSDAAMTQVIGSTTIPAGIGGCTRQSTAATIVWNNAGLNTENFWVKVDGQNQQFESNELDNSVSGVMRLRAETADSLHQVR